MKNEIWLFLKVIFVLLLFFSLGPFSEAEQLPKLVQIDALSQYFGGVEFDHELHLGFTENCSDCHHHRFDNGVSEEGCAKCHAGQQKEFSSACGDCHVTKPFDAASIRKAESNPERYHLDIIGLKGAYHINCRGCHLENGAPSGCQDCHQRTERGNRFYQVGQQAPSR
jgi:hypothetical protein